jgi:uncharacterized protein
MKKFVLFCLSLIQLSATLHGQELNTAGLCSRLYLGESKQQPLIVGLGGSEGGNAWASDYWKPTRDKFIADGYAFLAIGYFACEGAPDTLDRIALDRVHDAIIQASKNPAIDNQKIAIIGGSRGADLALLISSLYRDIKCVIAIVPSHVAFPGHTAHFSTSAWTYNGKEVPFVPVNEEAVPYLIKRDLRGAFQMMLKDTAAEAKAAIKVEKINGPVLLISATNDEIIPSTAMSASMIERFKANNFKHHVDHLAIQGNHAEPLKHFDAVFVFLENHFK